jgi:hypothetical protein
MKTRTVIAGSMLAACGQAAATFVPLACGAISSPEASAEEAGSRLHRIMSTSSWKTIRDLWRDLDRRSAPDGSMWYGGALGYEEADSVRAELRTALDGLSTAAESMGISAPEIPVLRALCMRRIETLLWGERSMMTRMMSPSATMEADRAMTFLEMRIDTLLALRDAGVISGEDWRSAAQCAAEAATAGIMLETISGFQTYDWSPISDAWLLDGSPPTAADYWVLVNMRLSDLERMRESSPAWKQAAEVLEQADSLKSLMPGVETLLLDLLTS